jgi:hypothetical protein
MLAPVAKTKADVTPAEATPKEIPNEATPTVPVNQETSPDGEPSPAGFPPPGTADKAPRARSKHRLVLKAVSDVKKVRAAASKPAPARSEQAGKKSKAAFEEFGPPPAATQRK